MPGNQASAVPQGDIRGRARPESEGDTDQPAATRGRVEEVRQLMCALDSRVEGNTLLEDYESVYNARWHHVMEVPGGEGTGMEVHEGKPPQPWTYKAVGRTLEKDDGVGAVRCTTSQADGAYLGQGMATPVQERN
ncbi:putative retrotransposon hot spot (RHS) protein [Trypanosoma cruzi]|uniref:Putative retrotransposon hot spot (RHS) protein n=1 Tax=Trypanosoma cruzi TaxID=5693 RepID=A0A2V2UIE7_TRYCR|nr:putative retrotransposon hot spot (RHS) protein [Trypanosoma cruzi]